MEDFEDEWIQVETEMHYTHNGSFSITLSRLSDGKRLVQRSFDDIDLWRKGAISIRNKFGIYRSFGKTLTDENDRPTNGIKDEHILLAVSRYTRKTRILIRNRMIKKKLLK